VSRVANDALEATVIWAIELRRLRREERKGVRQMRDGERDKEGGPMEREVSHWEMKFDRQFEAGHETVV
jgi:hypothetical protein